MRFPSFLAFLFLLICSTFHAVAQDFSIKGRWGFNVEENGYNLLGIVLINSGSSTANVTVNLHTATFGVSPSLGSGSYVSSYSNSGVTGTVPVGTSRWCPVPVKVKVLSTTDIGSHNITFTCTFVINGQTVTRTFPARSWNFIAVGSSPVPNDLIGLSPTYLVGSMQYFSGSGSSASNSSAIAAIDVAAASTDTGKFTLHGVPGSARVVLKYDSVTKQSWTFNHDSVTLLTPNPDCVYDSTTPFADIGKQWQIYINGSLVKTGMIAATDILFGASYNIYVEWSPDWNYPVEIPTDDGDVLVSPNGIDPDVPDPSHVRPEPGPIPGSDPKNDTTVDSDGTGPGTGLSVRDIYRAQRAALEDTLRTPDGAGFNFSNWDGGVSVGDSSAEALGTGLGTVFGSMQATLGTNPIGGLSSIGGSPVIAFTMFGRSFSYGVPENASIARAFGVVLLIMLTVLACIRMIRSAFAG